MRDGDVVTPVKAGTRVRYQGSLGNHHGIGTVLQADNYDHLTTKSDDGHRYVIRLDSGQPLYNVRRQSFTEYEDETTFAALEVDE